MTAVLELARAVLDDTRNWGEHANCIGKAHVLEGPDVVAAKQLCAACPVIQQCHAWVFPMRGKSDPGGVRAGRTEAERETLRRSTGQKRARQPKPPTRPDEKYCGRCQQIKPRDQFHQNKHHKDGLATYCRPCAADIQAIRRGTKEVAA